MRLGHTGPSVECRKRRVPHTLQFFDGMESDAVILIPLHLLLEESDIEPTSAL